MIRSVWIFLLGSVAAPLYRPFYSRRNITAKPTNILFSQMHFIIAGCCKHQLYCIPAIQEATRRSWTTHLCREFWWCDQACGWHTEGLLMLRNWFLYFFFKFKSAFPSEALVFSDLIKNWNRSDHLPPPIHTAISIITGWWGLRLNTFATAFKKNSYCINWCNYCKKIDIA